VHKREAKAGSYFDWQEIAWHNTYLEENGEVLQCGAQTEAVKMVLMDG
jgi:hypothetical protein